MTDAAVIRELVQSYAIAVDHRAHDEFVQLWAAQGRLVIHREGPERPPTSEYRIPEDAERFIESLLVWDRSLHLVSTHQVTINDNGASGTGEAYCEAHYVLGSTDLVMAVRYDDDYVKSSDRWLLRRRAVNVLWTAEHLVTANP